MRMLNGRCGDEFRCLIERRVVESRGRREAQNKTSCVSSTRQSQHIPVVNTDFGNSNQYSKSSRAIYTINGSFDLQKEQMSISNLLAVTSTETVMDSPRYLSLEELLSRAEEGASSNVVALLQ